jgi:hypothetical protein
VATILRPTLVEEKNLSAYLCYGLAMVVFHPPHPFL